MTFNAPRLITLALVFIVALPPRTARAQQTQQPIEPEEVIHLFDGEDLEGWYSWIPGSGHDDPKRVFSVVRNIDGFPALRISGEEKGSLITEQRYTNYHLIAEYRWGPVTWAWYPDVPTGAHRARDSGIQIHCQGNDGNWRQHRNSAFMYGIQYQLREGRIGDFILMGGWNEDGTAMEGPFLTATARETEGGLRYHWNGEPTRMSDQVDDESRIRQMHWVGHDPDWTNLKGYRGNADLERPVGEWNTVEIIARGDEITYKLNGSVINAGTNASVAEGNILLQSEFAEIYFRRIDLLPLPEQDD